MKKDVRNKCEELWEDEDYQMGLEKLIEYKLMRSFRKILEKKVKGEQWFNDKDWDFNSRKKITLGKKKWNLKSYSDLYDEEYDSRIFFKVNPINPTGDSRIAVKIHHRSVIKKNDGFMDGELHNEFQERLREEKPEEFNPVNGNMYIRALCYEDFKPENYPYLVNWTVEKLRALNKNCSPIIEEYIKKGVKEE